jgi:hypothetical protein
MVAQEETQEKILMSDLIPVQDNDPVSARLRMSGECQLLWAILEDAMECYTHYVNNPSENAHLQFREAEEWIDSEEEEWLCSFISICRAFQIEPDYLRGRLDERVEVLRDPPLQKAA